MNTTHPRLILTPTLLAVSIFVAMLGGCSSNESAPAGATCGAGTVLIDGVCTAAVDATGDNGASNDSGGTAEDASVPSDDSDGNIVDTADSSGGDTEVADTAGEAGVDAADASADDPCPTSLNINCSSTCGSAPCYYTCPTAPPFVPKIPASPMPYVIRTPSAPASDPYCNRDGCNHRYAFVFNYEWPRIRVRVGSGWRIGASLDGTPMCVRPGSTTGCYYTDTYFPIIVYTDDPSAPARNITIDMPSLEAGAPCP
jgi:hypothetical protein